MLIATVQRLKTNKPNPFYLTYSWVLKGHGELAISTDPPTNVA